LGVLLVSAVAVAAFAALDGVSLKPRPKAGDQRQYKVSAEFNSDQFQAKFSQDQLQKILDVKADGGYTVETTNTNTKIEVSGQSVDGPEDKSTSTHEATNRVTKIEGSQAPDATVYRLARLNTFEAPDKTVSVGDTFDVTVPADSKLGTPAQKNTYKVEAMEKVKDWDTAKITFTHEETEGTDKSSIKGTVWINTADGSMVKNEGTWNNVHVTGVPTALNGTYKAERTK
jgi:hypothetical protein